MPPVNADAARVCTPDEVAETLRFLAGIDDEAVEGERDADGD